MIKKIVQEHNALVDSLLQNDVSTEEELRHHLTMISLLQHERIAHLHVLLGTLLCTLISLLIFILTTELATLLLLLLFTLLFIPYVFHYYVLENTLQKWFSAYQKLQKKHL